MTGYGSAVGQVLGGRLAIEIRSVNHRYFNPQLKLPSELAGIESQVRERLRQLIERGHVVVSARWLEPPATEAALSLDLVRARQVVAAAQELKKRLKLKGAVDLAFVARHPDVLAFERDGASAEWTEVEGIVAQAAQALIQMRVREGAVLVAELAAGVAVDEQRLAVEVALLADRVDITEELVRLRTHLAACRDALGQDGAVGKQLGFLAQELLREVNTIGSKANDAVITQTVIAMKGELEKFREQLENLE